MATSRKNSVLHAGFSGASACDTAKQSGAALDFKLRPESRKGSKMASAQQLIGLVKSHAEGDEERCFDLAMQLAAAEEQ